MDVKKKELKGGTKGRRDERKISVYEEEKLKETEKRLKKGEEGRTTQVFLENKSEKKREKTEVLRERGISNACELGTYLCNPQSRGRNKGGNEMGVKGRERI